MIMLVRDQGVIIDSVSESNPIGTKKDQSVKKREGEKEQRRWACKLRGRSGGL